jgi:hypothetical protein
MGDDYGTTRIQRQIQTAGSGWQADPLPCRLFSLCAAKRRKGRIDRGEKEKKNCCKERKERPPHTISRQRAVISLSVSVSNPLPAVSWVRSR